MTRAWVTNQALATQWLRRRRLPVGRVARHRRMLRRGLAGRPVGRVLVVGPWRAARQALPAADLDVAGTSPHTPEVTVCSSVSAVGSLPASRWDTVILSDAATRVPERLRALRQACRPGARLAVFGKRTWTEHGPELSALAETGAVERVVDARADRLIVIAVSA